MLYMRTCYLLTALFKASILYRHFGCVNRILKFHIINICSHLFGLRNQPFVIEIPNFWLCFVTNIRRIILLGCNLFIRNSKYSRFHPYLKKYFHNTSYGFHLQSMHLSPINASSNSTCK